MFESNRIAVIMVTYEIQYSSPLNWKIWMLKICDCNRDFQSIKKGFAELTTQKWSTSALETFTSPPPNTEMNTNTDDTYANDNRTYRHENKHDQHRHLNRQQYDIMSLHKNNLGAKLPAFINIRTQKMVISLYTWRYILNV